MRCSNLAADGLWGDTQGVGGSCQVDDNAMYNAEAFENVGEIGANGGYRLKCSRALHSL